MWICLLIAWNALHALSLSSLTTIFIYFYHTMTVGANMIVVFYFAFWWCLHEPHTNLSPPCLHHVTSNTHMYPPNHSKSKDPIQAPAQEVRDTDVVHWQQVTQGCDIESRCTYSYRLLHEESVGTDYSVMGFWGSAVSLVTSFTVSQGIMVITMRNGRMTPNVNHVSGMTTDGSNARPLMNYVVACGKWFLFSASYRKWLMRQ